jgi:dolichyl-phosphate-mannose--protein O-mannosyl transferase
VGAFDGDHSFLRCFSPRSPAKIRRVFAVRALGIGAVSRLFAGLLVKTVYDSYKIWLSYAYYSLFFDGHILLRFRQKLILRQIL